MLRRALLLGLCLAGTPVLADTTPPPKKGEKAKGKTGAACKTDADCDQSQMPQQCRAAKCEVDMPPPAT